MKDGEQRVRQAYWRVAGSGKGRKHEGSNMTSVEYSFSEIDDKGVSMSKRRVAVAFVCCIAMIAALALAGGCGENGEKGEETTDKPTIQFIDPETGAVGSEFKLMGENFGTKKGDGEINIGGKAAEAVAWSGTKITAKVPSGLAAATYGVILTNSLGESNEMPFTVVEGEKKQPEGKEGQAEHVTAAQAMIEWLSKQGKNTAGYQFSIVQVSNKDPNWKIDKASKTGESDIYFLLHLESGNWVIKDDGTALTKDQLTAKGAPDDLYSVSPPKPQGTSQTQAVVDYMKSKGMDATGVSVAITRNSRTDPSWVLGVVRKSGQPDQQVVFHKEGSNWVVKGMAQSYTYDQLVSMGVPKDIAHSDTEAQAIASWIKAGNAPPGVTAEGWGLSVISVSRTDPDWEIIKGVQEGQAGTMYFLLHWENDNWVVKDDAGELSPQQLTAPGMPPDLFPAQ